MLKRQGWKNQTEIFCGEISSNRRHNNAVQSSQHGYQWITLRPDPWSKYNYFSDGPPGFGGLRPPSWWVRAASFAPPLRLGLLRLKPRVSRGDKIRASPPGARRSFCFCCSVWPPGSVPGLAYGPFAPGWRPEVVWPPASRVLGAGRLLDGRPTGVRPTRPARPSGTPASGAPGSDSELGHVIRSGARLSWPRAPARPDSDARGPTLTS